MITPAMRETVRHFIPVPAHITACASACAYDLLHGPAYAAIPAEGIEHFTVDDYASYTSDLDGNVTEVYMGPVGNALREFIDALPSELFYEPDCDGISKHEPEGCYIDPDGQECDAFTEGAEWLEPPDHYLLERADIVEALFGRTIAKEFN